MHPDEAVACWTGNAADGVEPLMALERAVSKDELMERAWPGVVVEETNLSVQIAALRKTLEERKLLVAWYESAVTR